MLVSPNTELFTAVSTAELLSERINALLQNLEYGARLCLTAAISRNQAMRGRDALNEVLLRTGYRSAGRDIEIEMPDTHLSLTHSGDLAVAVHANLRSQSLELIGTGIDVELHREVNPRTSRFFLQPGEFQESNHDLLRLWTVKEALFKADITNRTTARLPGQYRTREPKELCGFADHPELQAVRFVYASTQLRCAVVTVAVAVKERKL